MSSSLSTWDLMVTAMRSVGSAWTMAAFGIVLTRKGVITPPVKKAMAKVTSTALLPALLASNILGCTQNWSTDPCPSITDSLSLAWPLLLTPVLNVMVGSLLGKAVVWITQPEPDFRRATVAACGFANSTGLPITLLTVVHQSFSSSTNLGSVNPVLYVSVYLLVSPVLQWSVGAQLMGVNERRPDPIAEAPAPASDDYALLKAPEDAPLPPQLQPATSWTARARRFMTPPVVATLAAILIALTPVWGWVVDTADRDDDAPLEWMFDAATTMGGAAVPCQMMILGSSLSRGADFSAVKWTTAVGIALAKLLVMPVFGVLCAVALHATVLPSSNSSAASVLLVVMIETCTPTANTMLVMAELAGQNREALATCIFVQYLMTPVMLTASVSVFVGLARGW